MGKNKRSKVAVKARSKKRRKFKKESYLKSKSQNKETSDNEKKETLDNGKKETKDNKEKVSEDRCEITNVNILDGSKDNEKKYRLINGDRVDINQKYQNLTDFDDFYKYMNTDPLFSSMVKYQRNKRYTAFLSRKIQKEDFL